MKQSAFTLIEALVAIAIIAVLTSVLTLNYSSMRNRLALLRSAHQLAQDLRRAQEMATSAKELATGDVPAGYGIYLTEGAGQTSYDLYADSVLENEVWDNGETLGSPISLEDKICIIDITDATAVSVNFKGPDPLTNISNGERDVTITLALTTDLSITQEIVVNRVGLIYVK